jgi:hypothetical protein
MLLDYFLMQDEDKFREEQNDWIISELERNTLSRNQDWSEAIAVGGKTFTADIQHQLLSRAQSRSVISANGTTVLKEPEISYSTVFCAQKGILSNENTYMWEINI